MWVVDPTGLASGGSSHKLKADPETGTGNAFTESSWYRIWKSRVSFSRIYPCPSYLNIVNSNNLLVPFLTAYILVMLVWEPFRYLFMFPLSYKHPQGQADLRCVFMKPDSQQHMWQKSGWRWRAFCCWVRLKQVPEGWRWVVVRWWRWAIWSSLSSCVCCVCSVLCLVPFSIWNSVSCHWYGERFPILRDPVSVLPGLWSSSCSPLLLELTAPSFLLPRTLLLFYYSTATVLLVDLGAFLLFPDCDLFEQVGCIWLISVFP